MKQCKYTLAAISLSPRSIVLVKLIVAQLVKNLKICCCVHRSLLLVSILSMINPVCAHYIPHILILFSNLCVGVPFSIVLFPRFRVQILTQRLAILRFFHDFLSPSRQMSRWYLKLGHNYFLSCYFKFIID
jgi:hypothetical protein